MLVTALIVVMGFSAPAFAAGDVSVTIAPIGSTEVQSGQNISFEIQWQCGGTTTSNCAGGKIEVPMPVGTPDNVQLSFESATSVTIDGVDYAATIEGSGADRKIVWHFPESMPTTQSYQGTVSFTLKTQTLITPDDTKVTPTVTIEAPAGTASETSATVNVNSEATLKIDKKVIPEYRPDPYVNTDVTYQVRVGYERQWGPNGSFSFFENLCSASPQGMWALQDLVVVDTLPAGSIYKASSHDGVYDPATHTVTWDIGTNFNLDSSGVATCDGSKFGKSLLVTVEYPRDEFADEVADVVQVTNNATVTGSPYLHPEIPLEDEDSVSHYLQDGADGEFSVQKSRSYADSNSRGWELARGDRLTAGDNVRGFLHSFNLSGTGSTSGTWSMVDMLPCGWTSPTDTNSTDCATPAYRNISFGANGNMSELKINWITNLGTTGVCTIPQGYTVGDATIRRCDGLDERDPVGGLDPNTEWITKIWLDENPMKAGTQGKVFLFGSISKDIPVDNSAAVANGEYQPHVLESNGGVLTPSNEVTPASQHPLWVTVENCTAENTVSWEGGSMTTNGANVNPNHDGRCGYSRIVRDPVRLVTSKRMYIPAAAAGGASKDAEPSLVPGELFRVEVIAKRDRWGENPPEGVLTPTITEILPANLAFDPTDPANPVHLRLSDSGPDNPGAVAQKLGDPVLTVSEVVIDGVTRTKLVVTFPNAPAPEDGGGLAIENSSGQQDILYAGFDVRVKDGTIAGTGSNYTMVQAAEAADGFLDCGWPSNYADPDQLVASTTWADLSFAESDVQGPDGDTGCRATQRYTVVEGPALRSQKEVQGVRDADFISSPGVGSSDSTGVAHYRIPVKNSGNVEVRDVVVYDLLPRVGDTGVKPGAGARGSEYNVYMTGPLTGYSGNATIQYSTAANPCRGELAGNGGGARNSAPAGCTDDWSANTPADWKDVTAIRIDFGSHKWAVGELMTGTFPVVAGLEEADGDQTGIAWNNTAIAAKRDSNGANMLPSEAPRVGLQLNPDLTWTKVDSITDALLAGSEWTLTPAEGQSPGGEWPKEIVDCVTAPCAEDGDLDPAAGQFKLEGIPWGTYQLEETKAPENYVLPTAAIQLVIGPGNLNRDTWTYEVGSIENSRAGVDVTWEKVDPDGKSLSGSEWELVQLDENGDEVPDTALPVTDCIQAQPENCMGADKDPAAGKFLVSYVAPGSYQLVETKAPAGFVKLTDPVPVTVDGGTAVDLGEIVNEQVTVPPLPFTGGIGSYLFLLGGGLFLGLTVLLVARSARSRRIA